MSVKVVRLDIAKSVFHIHGVGADGKVLLRKRCARDLFLAEMAKLQPCLVGLEAGSGAHHWARELVKLGHEVRLMPPQYVRPYVKRNKHDAADAEACCEAVQRPGMRFVPIKSVFQQSTLMLHRVRDHFIRRRTGAINALRGHLAEFGLVAASQRAGLNRLLELVDASDDRLPEQCRELLQLITAEIRSYDEAIFGLDRQLKEQSRSDEVSRRLSAIPGIGPIIATAIPAHLVTAGIFGSGRSFAAWLGLTPKQHSSGGRERVFGISKRGNSYLRRQLINGARAVVRVARGRKGYLWDWVNQLLERRHFNIVTAAVAAKLARIMWAMVTKGTTWQAA
jgi:transposase